MGKTLNGESRKLYRMKKAGWRKAVQSFRHLCIHLCDLIHQFSMKKGGLLYEKDIGRSVQFKINYA